MKDFGRSAMTLVVSVAVLAGLCPAASGQTLQASTKAVKESSSRRGETTKTNQPAKAANSSAAASVEADFDVYRIGIEDELQISVWREPELSVSVVVRPDGKITMPLLNDIAVVGLRTDELQSVLTERLKSVVNEPQVTIIVRQIHSRKVYLFGEVARPGTFTLNTKKSVLELLAEGGGFTPFASRDSVYILRRTKEGKQVRLPFNYKKALTGHSENLLLLPGDVVVVR